MKTGHYQNNLSFKESVFRRMNIQNHLILQRQSKRHGLWEQLPRLCQYNGLPPLRSYLRLLSKPTTAELTCRGFSPHSVLVDLFCSLSVYISLALQQQLWLCVRVCLTSLANLYSHVDKIHSLLIFTSQHLAIYSKYRLLKE